MFEAVPSFTVKHSDAVEGADNQQSPGDPDAYGGQHPGHITRLKRRGRIKHLPILLCKITDLVEGVCEHLFSSGSSGFHFDLGFGLKLGHSNTR